MQGIRINTIELAIDETISAGEPLNTGRGWKREGMKRYKAMMTGNLKIRRYRDNSCGSERGHGCLWSIRNY